MIKFFKEYATYLGLPFCILLGAFRSKRYKKIETFCCFIGYSRSGHTIVGSLLDAHPDIVISTEADAFKLIKQGYRRNAFYYYLEFWSKFISKVLGNKWTGYDYHVPGWYQGQQKKPRVIGDKKGSKSLKRIMANPNLTEVMAKRTGIPVKYVHVIRNPFDNIATMHNRDPEVRNVTNEKTKAEKGTTTLSESLLKRKINVYFRKASGLSDLLNEQNLDVLNVHHEDLISKPEWTLNRILEFIGLDAPKEYLEACAGIIFESPNKSRNSIEWPAKLKRKVLKKSSKISFLREYSFEE